MRSVTGTTTRPRPASPVRSLAAAGVASLLLLAAGCGEDSPGSPDVPAPDGPATSLTIEVVATEGGEPRTMTLTCDPAGGDHPNAAAACQSLSAAGADVFEPVPKDQACTMIFGGPQRATVTGTLEGQDVDAAFERSNGCEMQRWDTLGTEVFDVPLQ